VRTVFVSTHPIAQHKIAGLRDVRTGAAEFRRLVRSLALLLAQEATADLATTANEVTTPLGPSPSRTLSDLVGIVPILRAGLGMADGILDLIPEAEVWHIGLYRDEATLRPCEYYNKLPARTRVTVALLVDPMLATGGSAVHACEIIKAAGVPNMKLLSLIAAPEGIENMQRAMPDVPIYVAAVDERLNEVGYIFPGLGDAGDRQFGTSPGPIQH
jgi:uracil phosphoribosyltransferase